jgi:hypothetical protein
VLAWEQAQLKLQHARGEGRQLALQVDFEYNPGLLLPEPMEERIPSGLERAACSMLGVASSDGEIHRYELGTGQTDLGRLP